MPTTRKKIIKTVYKNENSEEESGDFSDSGSEAKISDEEYSTGDEFDNVKSKQIKIKSVRKQKKNSKSFSSKLHKPQMSTSIDNENVEESHTLFSIKDLTDADKLLPPVLNLSESDSSSEDESPKPKKQVPTPAPVQGQDVDSDNEIKIEYTDVWSKNLKDESEEIANRKFFELEQHTKKLEETKTSIMNYTAKLDKENESNIKDLLALGEEVVPTTSPFKKKLKSRRTKEDSDSDLEDWEEVKENKAIPQQGLQLIVDIPGAVCRKSKQIDVEMMMKRKMNRVKKEYQVYMHKVHVLCWLGHGNYVSRVLNDQEVMAAALKMVPGKECYPGERVDMKYVEQITTWYKDKLLLKQDKYEEKFRPKAPPLKEILLEQMKRRVVTTKKYMVFIFVSMLRALGLQCRVMFNFVTLPIKPPSSELCSLSTKPKDDKNASIKKSDSDNKSGKAKSDEKTSNKGKSKPKISQMDGNDDNMSCGENYERILQLDGSNDTLNVQTRKTRSIKAKNTINEHDISKEDVSPPKRSRKSLSPNTANLSKTKKNIKSDDVITSHDKIKTNVKNNRKELSATKTINSLNKTTNDQETNKKVADNPIPQKTRSNSNKNTLNSLDKKEPVNNRTKSKPPTIVVTNQNENVSSEYFDNKKNNDGDKLRLSRKRSKTINPTNCQISIESNDIIKVTKSKTRTKSAPVKPETSKYFGDSDDRLTPVKKHKVKLGLKSDKKEENDLEDNQRVSHRDLTKLETKPKNDVTGDLINIIKRRVKEAKVDAKKGIVKGKLKKESDDDSDFLPEENIKHKNESDDDFKPSKISPKPSTSNTRKTSAGRRIDRRVVSTDDETIPNKVNVWCEIFVEELEQWVCVDVITGKIHCSEYIYGRATHPVCYAVGWDNNNYLKDVTRRYVPHWNTVTRKQRAEPVWWNTAIAPWLGPKTARDREEDQYLDRMQLEAPLPKSIAEYKNHPLYALKRHLLKYEAIYPPDAATLGFVRQEAVYARECVYICRSRDTWLKEAKVVRLGEVPYKIVKARPKWDKLSNKVITDKPLEIFGPWQVQDYEPPVAENGVVPRNAYGNVELFKDCMLPKGTVHIKLPGLNKVAKKLNIDCAPAMTGFDFNGGWSHPVFDGFVVCAEFEEIITDAWVKDQEEQERREIEKTEARVYGNWRRLIKGLLIRERLRHKYGFEEPSTSASKDNKKSKGPRLVVKKRS
ncbi:DNA repair protein complementing XP-C cells homolog [Aphomia sociella]